MGTQVDENMWKSVTAGLLRRKSFEKNVRRKIIVKPEKITPIKCFNASMARYSTLMLTKPPMINLQSREDIAQETIRLVMPIPGLPPR